MKFRVNVQDLSDGMNNVSRALEVRPAKQILEGVLIDATDGQVVLTCTDGQKTIECVMTAMVAEPGRAVLPCKLFLEIVRKLPAEDVQVTTDDYALAEIRCGKFKASLSGMNPAEFPEMNDHFDGKVINLPQKTLIEMINHVHFAVALDESKPILTGCLIEVEPTEMRMIALDGYRMAINREAGSFETPDGKKLAVVVPGKVMTDLSYMMKEEDAPCQFTFSDSRMKAEFGNTKVCSVLLAGEFIDYNRILPKEFATEVKVNRQDLMNAIDRASLMAREGKNNLIRLLIGTEKGNEERMIVSSNADKGNINENIEIEINGDPLNIAFNARYISDVIKNIDNEEICMKFNSSVSPCIITPLEGNQYLYLILPVRVFA